MKLSIKKVLLNKKILKGVDGVKNKTIKLLKNKKLKKIQVWIFLFKTLYNNSKIIQKIKNREKYL